MILTPSVLFYLRKQKTNKRGQAPIYCKITFKYEIFKDFSTGIFVDPFDWNFNTYSTGDESLDDILTNIYCIVNKSFAECFKKYDIFCKEKFGEILQKNLGIEEVEEKVVAKTFLDIALEHNEFKINNKLRPLSPNTTRHYNPNRLVFEKFLKRKQKLNLKIDEVDEGFIQDFVAEMNITPVTLKKLVIYLRNVIDYAILKKYTQVNTLRALKIDYKISQKTGIEKETKVYLNKIQREQILNANYSRKSYKQAADIFCLQMNTGMAYADIQAFDFEKDTQEVNGQMWICKKREKSNVILKVPLLPHAIEILKSFNYKIPKISNQKYNAYLKIVAKESKVNISLSSHMGRSTFGNILVNEYNINIEDVAKAMGHTSSKTTEQYYTEVNFSRLADSLKEMIKEG